VFYLDLFRALNDAGVRYVLVGGVALNLHGVERATMDVDIAIALDADNLSRAVAALRALGLQPIAPISWDEITRPGQLERWYRDKHMLALGLRKTTGFAPSVDILTKTPMSFDVLQAQCETKDIGGIPVSVASIDDLIMLKRNTGRAIDVSDIAALEALKQLRDGSNENH
jgi:hypothetical protein